MWHKLSRSMSFNRIFRIFLSSKAPNYGICFDIDGVLARGYVPLPEAVKAFSLLQDQSHQFICPIAFVTNGMALHRPKAQQLSTWLNVSVDADQVVCVQTPLQCYDHLKSKHCLLVGQGPLKQIAAELGFLNTCLMEEVSAAYPLLDVTLLQKKQKIAHIEHQIDTDFPRVEAILILGEPGYWESALQLCVDLLLTGGKPDSHSTRHHHQTLPIVACNKDLQYAHRAVHPRFGNGTFLLCLEGVFKKLIGKELQYDALIGKPSEVTLRFAENQLTSQALQMGLGSPFKSMYMIGDNINSDIVAANLYQQFVLSSSSSSCSSSSSSCSSSSSQPHETGNQAHRPHHVDIPAARTLPASHPVHPQTVSRVTSILVRTGVYKGNDTVSEPQHIDHSHRDFRLKNSKVNLRKPDVIVDSVLQAVEYILERESS